MVVKNQIKFIKSLHQKKYRTQYGQFVAEGVKLVSELLESNLAVKGLYATEDFLEQNPNIPAQQVSHADLNRMSGLKTPNKVLGVFEIPVPAPLEFSDWILALEQVQDPGNLGTIIRLCDWFGIRHLLCTPDSADFYNPKTLQATMGSIARVNVVYDTLESVVKESGLAVFGATLTGESIYNTAMPESGILIMGNESRGISEKLLKSLHSEISIPAYGNSKAESLNVATATAIMLSEIRRQAIQK